MPKKRLLSVSSPSGSSPRFRFIGGKEGGAAGGKWGKRSGEGGSLGLGRARQPVPDCPTLNPIHPTGERQNKVAPLRLDIEPATKRG